MSSGLTRSLFRSSDHDYYPLFEIPELAVLLIFIQVSMAMLASDMCLESLTMAAGFEMNLDSPE